MPATITPAAVAPSILLSDNDIRRAFLTHNRANEAWVGPFAQSISSQVSLWAKRLNKSVRPLDLSPTAVQALERMSASAPTHQPILQAVSIARRIEGLMLA